MPTGPGKYDDICTDVRIAADADAVVLIVLGGTQGSGFSVQAVVHNLTKDLPTLLRAVAGEIELSLEEERDE